jgi:hypothetical protein
MEEQRRKHSVGLAVEDIHALDSKDVAGKGSLGHHRGAGHRAAP